HSENHHDEEAVDHATRGADPVGIAKGCDGRSGGRDRGPDSDGADDESRDDEVRLIIECGEEKPGDCDDEPACGYGASMSSRGCPRGAESHHGRGEEPPGEDIPR